MDMKIEIKKQIAMMLNVGISWQIVGTRSAQSAAQLSAGSALGTSTSAPMSMLDHVQKYFRGTLCRDY